MPMNTLAGLKRALNNGTAQEKFPVGHEIPDTYDGHDNPLIIAQYLDNTNNSSYGGVVGVILVRKYIEGIAGPFGNSYDYAASNIKNILDGDYITKSSDELKTIISEIQIPYYYGGVIVPIISKFFLPSAIEVMGTYRSGEGIGWDYWKQKTGLTSPNNDSNAGRTVYLAGSSTAQDVWLRSYSSSSDIFIVTSDGSIRLASRKTFRRYLPACFIAKD